MSAMESATNVLATADLEPAVEQENTNEVETKTSEDPDASTLSAQSSAMVDASSKIQADDVKVTEDESKDVNPSAAVESENAEKVSTTPAKEEVNEEIVTKGIPLKYVS
jgi:hypothetical protein